MYRVLQFSSAIYSVHFFQFEPVLHHVYYRIVGVRVTHCYALIIIYMYNFTLLQVCLSQMAQTTMLKPEGLHVVYSFEHCLIGSILTTCRSSKKRFNQGFFSNSKFDSEPPRFIYNNVVFWSRLSFYDFFLINQADFILVPRVLFLLHCNNEQLFTEVEVNSGGYSLSPKAAR